LVTCNGKRYIMYVTVIDLSMYMCMPTTHTKIYYRTYAYQQSRNACAKLSYGFENTVHYSDHLFAEYCTMRVQLLSFAVLINACIQLKRFTYYYFTSTKFIELMPALLYMLHHYHCSPHHYDLYFQWTDHLYFCQWLHYPLPLVCLQYYGNWKSNYFCRL